MEAARSTDIVGFVMVFTSVVQRLAAVCNISGPSHLQGQDVVREFCLAQKSKRD